MPRYDFGTGQWVYDGDPRASQQNADDLAKQIAGQTGQPNAAPVNDEIRQWLLSQQGALAGKFADQGEQGFGAYGQQAQGALAGLQAQAQGQSSVSAEQLRQGLQQQYAQQRSLAAGASPRNAAGAARTAAIQMGRAGTAMAGQQAVAGLQERNQAQGQYASLLSGMRSQELQAALSGRQNAAGAYGSGAYGGNQPSVVTQVLPAAAAAAAALAASDRRLKTDIQPGDAKANGAIAALQPYTYTYKDPQAYGTGPQLGTTTQDLTRAGLGQAVIKTPAGEMVDAGKLSGANTAMIAALGRRVQSLEGGAASPPADDRVRQFATDPKSAWAQFDLDQRRRVLAAPPTAQLPADPRAAGAQSELDRRRAVMAALARSAQVAQAGK